MTDMRVPMVDAVRRDLAITPDWKHLKGILDVRIRELQIALETATPDHGILAIQGRIAEIRNLIDVVEAAHRKHQTN